ncbi:MAG TPA: glycerophosphodiester phosphodiesterase [Candidatus Thermoplasmatota archaeon]|nr:glycerophosphodiester phosphodiesterase [Candidatus Thermoplasmatota archaeon]
MRQASIAVVLALLPVAAALPIQPNPWLGLPFLHFAHQGGEYEAPSDTMFALKSAIEKGADVLEMDLHRTSDGHIVVLHDATVDRTTEGTGRIDAMTLAQVQALDAAYWFVPDVGTTHSAPTSSYVYRGIATGARPPPAGYVASDFTIPTLDDVLATFPGVRVNLEIKQTAPDTRPYEGELAALLRAHGRKTDAMVVSFSDAAVELFHAQAPEISTATGTGNAALFFASSQGPSPGIPSIHQALQVPIVFEGITVVTPEFVQDAHASGLAVHVWTVDTRSEMEMLLDLGVDGIMTNRPTLLEQVLAERGP